MSELELTKTNIVKELRRLCAHCANGGSPLHRCPVQEISARVSNLRGIPLIVNDQFKGALWTRM